MWYKNCMIGISRTIVSLFVIFVILCNVLPYMMFFTLKKNGYEIGDFWGMIVFKSMKDLIENEASPQKKLHYKILLYSFFASFILSILLFVLLIVTEGSNH